MAYRNVPRWVELSSDWSDDDLDHLKEQRRFWARREQAVSDKKERKLCQRHVKAITCCVRYIEGEPTDFPAELEMIMLTALNFSHQQPRISFEDLYGAVAE